MVSGICFCLLTLASQDQPSYAFVGSMESLVIAGKKAGAVSTGQSFQIVLTEGGAKLSVTQFELKPRGSDKPLRLSFPGLSFVDGHLKGGSEIKNEVGSAIEGVRLDVIDATETYKAKDDQGKEVERTRPVTLSLPSPISFGDIADGESNGQVPIDIGGLAFKPETVSIAVRGVVSGERYVRSIALPSVAADGQIDVDAKGRIYLSSTVDNCVARVDNDGKNLVELCKLPDQCKGMAVNPVNGEIAATCGNHATIYFFDPDGNEKGKLADGVLENYSDSQRYDAKGRLWSNVSTTYVGFDAAHMPNSKIDKFGDFDPTGGRFDVASDGTMYSVTDDSVLVRHPDGSGGVFAKGNGDKLGQLFGVISVRLGPDGLVYVVENGANNIPLSTITVFTPSGEVVRAFGRGASKAMGNFPDGFWPSQLYRPSDVAFGRDGAIYVNTQNREGNGPVIMVFDPF